ncbi:YeeE/YedE family protein [Vibrio sp. Isolate23]|uniref:YeeE/YedE family protein n=1 Tax=Vibrio sp. Isolate23 TaxID=2908533 RepID=UPI001EFC7743|nr:YeeE/YedE family protein [Vibrio sp. Isolate23]MCG9681102.1 YeeE/YedE family protein [Vibrio sp. Isolate23]
MSGTFPWHSLIGGTLLGLSAAILLLFNAKTAGISGIVNGVFTPNRYDFLWRILFLSGMVSGGALSVSFLEIQVPSPDSISTSHLVVAGLLVGLGTRIGNGCTSGHGICGIGRFSLRSVVATLIFMFTAVVTVYVR